MVFPSLVIISILAGLITSFSHLLVVQQAMAGVRVCVCVLILNAVLKLSKSSIVDKIAFCIFLVVFLVSYFTSISPVICVVAAAIAGILVKVVGGART